MSGTNPPRRKRRTREHVIADLSVNYVERQVLLDGCTVEWLVHDYGIDLYLATYDDGGVLDPGQMPLQIKATDHPTLVAGGAAAAVVVEVADLRLWMAQTHPALVILYDAPNDRAYWLYVQRYAHEHQLRPDDLGATVTVRVPVANLLTPAAVREFRGFHLRVLTQVDGVVDHGPP